MLDIIGYRQLFRLKATKASDYPSDKHLQNEKKQHQFDSWTMGIRLRPLKHRKVK